MLFTASSSPKEIWSVIVQHLHQGASEPNHPFHFVNLCTLESKQPDSRYVVLREVNKDVQLKFYTDKRSDKVSQIGENPDVCLLFYHAEERCQVKIKGQAKMVTDEVELKNHWKYILPEAQKAYQSTLAPKTKIPLPEKGWEQEKAYQSKFFSVLNILPEQVECLQLDRDGHIRIAFEKENENWVSTWLVP
jgi:pyridoxine/pyridoxamine 5'-phosphate oxidase